MKIDKTAQKMDRKPRLQERAERWTRDRLKDEQKVPILEGGPGKWVGERRRWAESPKIGRKG